MSDAVTIDIGFSGGRAFSGLETLRGLLTSTGRVAERESNSIQRSIGGIGNARINTGFASGIESALSRVRSSVATTVGGITSQMGGLGGAMSNIASFVPALNLAAAATAGVAVGIGLVGKAALDAAAKVEIWKANLLTITGDAKKAEDSYAALVDFAEKTPFDLSQSVEGFIKLRTLGLEATEKALVSFGNTSAAMGKPLSQMIEAVADAATGEFERLKEFGIKSSKEGDKVKFTFAGVTTTVKNNAQEIQKYLEDLGNTKFGGAMARQMDTISGKMANVEDSMFQALAAIGGGQLGAAFKEILSTIAAGISAVTPLLASIGNVIGSVVGAVGKIINGLASVWSSISTGGQGVQPALDALATVFNGLAAAVDMLGNAMQTVFGGISRFINGAIGSLASYLGLNKQASAETATWGNLAQAAWEQIGKSAEAARTAIASALSGMWAGTKGVFTDIGKYLSEAFATPIAGIKQIWGGIKGWFNDLFGDLEFNPEGIVTGAARIVDLLIGTFRGGVAAIGVLFDQLPGAIWSSLSPGFQTILTGAKNLFVGIGQAIAAVYNAVVGFGKSVASNVASVFNAISAFIEKWVNKTIGAINSVIGAANKLGAGISEVAQVQIGRVQAPKAGAAENSAWTKLGNDMGKAFNGGFGHEAENGVKNIVKRARAIGRATGAAASGGLDSGTAPKPTPDSKDGKKGGKGKSDTKAAQEAKKYADAVQNLNDRIKDLTLTEEQKALADEMERAGLGRDITQVNAKADAIRNLFKTLRDGEQAKKVSEIIKDFNEKVRELAYSQEQLAQVEARRRAGLNTDLAYSDALTKKLDAETAAWYRKAKAKEAAAAIKDIERDQAQRGQDIAIDNNARVNADKADDERRIVQIQRERDANIERIRQIEGITAAKREELILNEQNLAKQLEQGVALDRQAQAASSLANFLTAMWDGPKQAFKTFISGVLRGLLEAIAKAVILGEKLGGKGGIGGLLTSVITGALGGSSGIAPGRASGGSVRKNQWTLVGENGPELMKFGAAGTIMNNRTARNALGSGGGNVTIGGTSIIVQGNASESSLNQMQAHLTAHERNMRAMVRDELKKQR
ncbi:hypothetical protein VH570_01385 [Sphingobium sp. HT1-2]|uniref:hypothetical protein n=1 Tax=Sphingobium sp. HT1-2 TaxID=3111640 RepID=UPI003C0AB71C